ncbi:MAG: D-arabinono-1,4-lactone oxidase [Solirubrobacteraceae bacterium]
MSEWRNWAGDQVCRPAAMVAPASRGELARVVASADKVRVAGAGHSFSDAVLTDGTLLSLERLDRVLDLDAASGQVRVEAGITLHALGERLAAHGLAFENLGDIDVQSIAGAMATGTHGTGARLANLSASVHSVELVLADGTIVEVDGGDDLLAARVSLGALGVVSAVTLQAVPAFTLEGVDAPVPLEATLDRLDELTAANQHFEFFTFPHSPLALTRTNNRTGAPPEPRGRARAYAEDIVLSNHAFAAFCLLGKARPGWIPALNRTMSRLAGSSRRVERSDRIFASPRRVRFNEMEYAIPRTHVAEAVRAVRALIDALALAVGFPLEVRFVAADDALLSPAGDRETGYVAVHMYRGMEWEPYFRAVEAIMDGYGGRPHWGKRHFQTAATLAPRYPGWTRFQAVRDRLDPGRKFTNAYVERVLGA